MNLKVTRALGTHTPSLKSMSTIGGGNTSHMKVRSFQKRRYRKSLLITRLADISWLGMVNISRILSSDPTVFQRSIASESLTNSISLIPPVINRALQGNLFKALRTDSCNILTYRL
ncbi:hypothetical protein AVEN_184137-1 [Araneus ventricosus]|uniref:Uncharacterized protein n=1 Tax=Araneus ventricosus TaxID=182803 RepID=A0A4Y2GDZ5_ARAVE|nr:hypothetical protein AVEN_132734-1 [Araneus ventricosus]GBM50818.1 hypothetical protein AVEN_184137-1 [Araneus ventricosus]